MLLLLFQLITSYIHWILWAKMQVSALSLYPLFVHTSLQRPESNVSQMVWFGSVDNIEGTEISQLWM